MKNFLNPISEDSYKLTVGVIINSIAHYSR